MIYLVLAGIILSGIALYCCMAQSSEISREEERRVCDHCDSQEGNHYCLLHGKQMKNMDISTCPDWEEKDEQM